MGSGSGPIGRILCTGCPVWRSFLWAAHCCAARAVNPHARAGRPARRAEAHRNACLFDVASGGVWPATDVATGAVSSYLAFSPLPFGRLDTMCPSAALGGLFSVPLSVATGLGAHSARPLAGTLPCEVRTFLRLRPQAVTGRRSPGPLPPPLYDAPSVTLRDTPSVGRRVAGAVQPA